MTAPLELAPGPTLIDPEVIQAMSGQPMYHQSPAFADVLDQTCHLLRPLYGTTSDVVVLPASGRGAVEASLMSLRRAHDTLVIPTNGAFGRMMVTIGCSLGFSVREVPVPDGRGITPDDVAESVAGVERPILGVVHNETSTGAVNDLAGLAEMVHARDGLLVVDTVSSLGGMPVEVDRHGVDLCASATQKAVGAPPGLGFVSVSARARESISGVEGSGGGHYLDLGRWWDQWVPVEQGGSLLSGFRRLPWTMPTNLVLALRRSLELTMAEGVERRWERHARCAAALRAAMATLGLRPVAEPGAESSTVGAFGIPADVGPELRRRLADRHRVVIAAGMGPDAASVIRIAHMAESARPGPLLHAVATMAHELRQFGLESASDPSKAFLEVWSGDAAAVTCADAG